MLKQKRELVTDIMGIGVQMKKLQTYGTGEPNKNGL